MDWPQQGSILLVLRTWSVQEGLFKDTLVASTFVFRRALLCYSVIAADDVIAISQVCIYRYDGTSQPLKAKRDLTDTRRDKVGILETPTRVRRYYYHVPLGSPLWKPPNWGPIIACSPTYLSRVCPRAWPRASSPSKLSTSVPKGPDLLSSMVFPNLIPGQCIQGMTRNDK